MKYIVTGSSNGIGRCIALRFLKEGHEVWGIDIDDRITAFKDYLEKFHFYKADIAYKEELDGFLESVKGVKFDGIINNAGINRGGLENCSYEDFGYVISIGLSAPFYLVKSLKESLNPNAGIVNIASTRAAMSEKNRESYAAAKGGIVALTHAMSISLRGKARVNCISPGWIDTADYCDRPKYEASHADIMQHPVERIGRPEDIAEMVLYLCSEKGSFIDGQDIVIDGGMSKQMIWHGDNNWIYDV
ncbi:MAG: SDR family oxidoreductase [Ruminococcaceae bacterium]|nr:SDR family oxidoreductase [Oscillospiraceae bacterium]